MSGNSRMVAETGFAVFCFMSAVAGMREIFDFSIVMTCRHRSQHLSIINVLS
jgi:hypothetical protein